MVLYARQSARAPLAVSLMLSLAVHVTLVGGAAGVLAARGFLRQYLPGFFASEEERKELKEREKRAAEADAVPVPEASDVVWVRPGIDDGASDSMAWIGYTTSTEHSAYESSVDQSAMTTDAPGMKGEDELPSNASPEVAASEAVIPILETPAPAQESATTSPAEQVRTASTPTDVQAEATAAPAPPDRKEAPTAVSVPPAPAAPPPPEASVVTRLPMDEPSAAPVKEAPEAPAQEPQEPKKEVDPRVMHGPERPDRAEAATDAKAEPSEEPPAPETAGPPAPATPVTDAPAPSNPPAAPAKEAAPSSTEQTPSAARPEARPAGLPGNVSDKEADATSIKQAVEYRNGRVRAGDGIDIKTVRPEFSNFTVLTALPKVPVVEITFNTQGKVKNVRMVQSSGYKDVDEPILNAVWAWTAKGKKLEAIGRDNPRAQLKISVRMLL
jgi:TonB family protein